MVRKEAHFFYEWLMKYMAERATVFFWLHTTGRRGAFAALPVKLDKIIELLDFSTIERGTKLQSRCTWVLMAGVKQGGG